VPWIWRFVISLLPRRPGIKPGYSMWDLWWTKLYWGLFCLEFFGFPLSLSFHQWSTIIVHHLRNVS